MQVYGFHRAVWKSPPDGPYRRWIAAQRKISVSCRTISQVWMQMPRGFIKCTTSARPREVRKRLPWGEVGALPICRLAGDKVYTRLKFINLLLVHRQTKQKADRGWRRRRRPFCHRQTNGLTGAVGVCQSIDWLGNSEKLGVKTKNPPAMGGFF